MTIPERESTFDRYRRLLTSGPSVERTVAFSDGVFAITMTLLVLDVRVPDSAPRGLAAALLDVLPTYLTFVLSFVVIGIVWMSHHRKFRAIARHDQTLLRLNLLMLLFVASIPFPTALLGRYGDDVLPVYVYATSIVLVGFGLTTVWAYAWGRGLLDPEVPHGVARFVFVQSLVMPTVFLASLPVAALWGATVGELSWLAAFPALLVVHAVYRRRGLSHRLSPEGSS